MALTHERVRQLLEYNPDTGVLTWKVRKAQCVKVGQVAGFVDGNGRRLVEIDGQTLYVSRVIWLWMTGRWPSGVVDHKDRDSLNNRWKNLRDVTQRVNAQNRRMNSNNKSGVRGVYWNNQWQKWHAQIAKDRKKIHLGWFNNFDDAVLARKHAESTLWNLPKGG